MKKLRTVLLILLLAVLLIGAYMLYNELAGKYEPEVPDILMETEETQAPAENGAAAADAAERTADLAPDFTVYDAEGNAVKLSDFRGKPVVINFWATWCGPCQSELPWFDQLHTRYGRDVEFMMVNLTDGYRDTVDSVTAYVEAYDYGFPLYFNTEGSVDISYNVSSIPVTVFVDEDGTIIRTVNGVISEKLLTNTVIKMAGDD